MKPSRKQYLSINIPDKVDYSDIQINGKLLTDNQIKYVKKFIVQNEFISGKKFPKNEFKKNIPFSILMILYENNQTKFFAIYKGKKREMK